MQDAFAWCTDSPCPLSCSDAQHICTNAAGEDRCFPLRSPCPVECGDDEQTCSEPGADATKNFEFCIPAADECPLVCKEDNQMCFKGDGTKFCRPALFPCPVECADTEVKCDQPVSSSNDVAFSWCLDSSSSCPKFCAAKQQVCINAAGEEFCHPLNVACPVTCLAEVEKRCKEDLADGSSFWFCVSSDKECPIRCSPGSQVCPTASGGEICHPASRPCPLQCEEAEYKCTEPSTMMSDAFSWCQFTPCPVICPDSQHVCSNLAGDEICQPRQIPCAVVCPDSEQKCVLKGSGDAASEFCISSSESCPVECNEGQQICLDSANNEVCHPATLPCPQVCRVQRQTIKRRLSAFLCDHVFCCYTQGEVHGQRGRVPHSGHRRELCVFLVLRRNCWLPSVLQS